MMPVEVPGVHIPDSKFTREVTQFIRDTESDLLFLHSVRVYCWGVLTGTWRGLKFDSELLYAASMLHDIGLTARYQSSQPRFEVDGANAARDFLRGHGVTNSDIETVWNAIALHTTPGIPQFMRPEIALVQVGAGVGVAGRGYDQFSEAQREAVVAAYPREADFAPRIIDAFYEGMKHRPLSTFGTFNDDVLAFKEPCFKRVDMCSIILASEWNKQTSCNVVGCHDHAHHHSDK